MSDDSAWPLVMWAFMVGFLVRRMMFGPQKKFALASMTLIWLGEAMLIVSEALPFLVRPGYLIEASGMGLLFTMLAVDWRWRVTRRKGT